MVTHSSILAWEIPWTEESGGLHGVTKESDLNKWLNNKVTRTSINPFILQVKMKAAHCNNLDSLVIIFFPIDMIYLGIFLT